MKLTRMRTLWLATVPLLAVGAVTAAPMGAASAPTLASPSPAMVAPASPQAQFRHQGSTLTLAVPAAADSPGYTVVVRTSPFQITTKRSGGTVLQTTAGVAGSSGPADFQTASGWATATSVQSSSWHDGVLDLTLATTATGDTVAYRITPQADRYRMTWSVLGTAAATQVASHYLIASAGHWYGQGEAQTPGGGPYTQQPWPLDSGTVRDSTMGPAEYLMTDPFWFTQRGTGLWVNTNDVMDVAMNAIQPGVFGYALTGGKAMDSTVFVERTPRQVYQDYIGITGTPAKSDATPAQYAKPLFNSWAQFYTDVTQASTLSWATGLHKAGVPLQAIQVDDGWATHYGDTTFNSKFPDPKALSDQIHAMGYDFGLWETLDQQQRHQLFLCRPARLPAEVEGGSGPALQRDLVERRCRHRGSRQSRRTGLVCGPATGPGEDLRRERFQVRHPLLRRVLRAVAGLHRARLPDPRGPDG